MFVPSVSVSVGQDKRPSAWMEGARTGRGAEPCSEGKYYAILYLKLFNNNVKKIIN